MRSFYLTIMRGDGRFPTNRYHAIITPIRNRIGIFCRQQLDSGDQGILFLPLHSFLFCAYTEFMRAAAQVMYPKVLSLAKSEDRYSSVLQFLIESGPWAQN